LNNHKISDTKQKLTRLKDKIKLIHRTNRRWSAGHWTCDYCYSTAKATSDHAVHKSQTGNEKIYIL